MTDASKVYSNVNTTSVNNHLPNRNANGRAQRHGTSVLMTAISPQTEQNRLASDTNGTEISGDQFADSVAEMTVAHVVKNVGFDTIQKSAVNVLVDVLHQYIRRIGTASKEVAELAGRTQPRASDVLSALYDLNPVPTTNADLIQALQHEDPAGRLPFPREIPIFPVQGTISRKPDTMKRTNNLPPHIPSFLPPFPSPYTYSMDRPAVISRDTSVKHTRMIMAEQKASLHQSLHHLQSTDSNHTKDLRKPFQDLRSFSGDSEISVGKRRDFNPTAQALSGATKRLKLDTRSAGNDVNETLKASNAGLASGELGKEERILTGTFHDGDSE